MKKRFYIIFIFISVIMLSLNAQNKLRIDFSPGSSGDFEIFLKNGFEKLGYNVFINYYDRKSDLSFDKRIAYFDISRDEELKEIELFLIENNGDTINSAKISPAIYSKNNVKNTYRAIEKLTGKEVPYDKTEEQHISFSNNYSYLKYELEKIDSAIYLITVKGLDKDNADILEEAFLAKTKQLLNDNGFEYYTKPSYYGYVETSGMYSFNYVKMQIKGIAITSEKNGSKETTKLETYPEKYYTYINEHHGFLDKIIKLTEPTAGKANIYILRSTGYNLSARNFSSFINGKLLCKMQNNKYSTHSVDPGKYTYSVQMGGNKIKPNSRKIELNIEAGKSYFIQLLLEASMGSTVYCQEIEEFNAKAMMLYLSEETECF